MLLSRSHFSYISWKFSSLQLSHVFNYIYFLKAWKAIHLFCFFIYLQWKYSSRRQNVCEENVAESTEKKSINAWQLHNHWYRFFSSFTSFLVPVKNVQAQTVNERHIFLRSFCFDQNVQAAAYSGQFTFLHKMDKHFWTTMTRISIPKRITSMSVSNDEKITISLLNKI